MLRPIAAKVARHGITVNAVSPLARERASRGSEPVAAME
jgi:NAD(P)-dependent dehydrogenase (short-subunit alcohol dehydrogenase family)